MPIRESAWPDGTPCWVDLMSPDAEAARAFYAGLFGWTYEIGDERTGFYALASVGDHLVAGIGTLMAEGQPTVWTTYLASSDVDAADTAITAAGGTVLQPALDVMDYGRMSIAQDPTGGTFGVWQAGSVIGTALFNESGALVWNELLTRDYAGAMAFYGTVFGYGFTEIGEQFGTWYSTVEVGDQSVGGIGTLPAALPEQVPSHWLVYFAVDDVDATVAKAVELGGSIQRPAADMPYGRHAGLADPSGAGFCVIKPAPGPQN